MRWIKYIYSVMMSWRQTKITFTFILLFTVYISYTFFSRNVSSHQQPLEPRNIFFLHLVMVRWIKDILPDGRIALCWDLMKGQRKKKRNLMIRFQKYLPPNYFSKIKQLSSFDVYSLIFYIILPKNINFWNVMFLTISLYFRMIHYRNYSMWFFVCH